MDPKKYDEFLKSLDHVAWFSQIGRPVEGKDISRVYYWEDWPGPEDDVVYLLHVQHQELQEELVKKGKEIQKMFDDIVAKVKKAAEKKVPFKKDEDASYGPTLAVWQAGWTAALVALCHYAERPVPPEIQLQWEWFKKGHWPCAFGGFTKQNKPEGLMVY